MRCTSMALLLLVLFGGPGMAAPIAEFTFPSTTTTSPNAVPQPSGYQPDVFVPNVEVTGIIAGSGLLASGAIVVVENVSPAYDNPLMTNPVLRVGPPSGTTNLSQSLNNNTYFEFTVTPDEGYLMNLEGLSFGAGRGGGSTERGFALFSSELGFAMGDEIFSGFIPAQRPNSTFFDFDLEDPMWGGIFQGITEPTTFRFNIFSPASGSTVEFDNIVVSGLVMEIPIIPEPSSLLVWSLMGAAGLGGAFAWRRVRRRPFGAK